MADDRLDSRVGDPESSRPVSAWEGAVAMALLWIVPAVAFVLVMIQSAARGS
jgi:hypothetical protein